MTAILPVNPIAPFEPHDDHRSTAKKDGKNRFGVLSYILPHTDALKTENVNYSSTPTDQK